MITSAAPGLGISSLCDWPSFTLRITISSKIVGTVTPNLRSTPLPVVSLPKILLVLPAVLLVLPAVVDRRDFANVAVVQKTLERMIFN